MKLVYLAHPFLGKPEVETLEEPSKIRSIGFNRVWLSHERKKI